MKNLDLFLPAPKATHYISPTVENSIFSAAAGPIGDSEQGVLEIVTGYVAAGSWPGQVFIEEWTGGAQPTGFRLYSDWGSGVDQPTILRVP